MATATLPTVQDLEMWPYVTDDSPLWDLEYAASVQDAILGKEDFEVEGWHEIMGWLFDLATASYAYAVCSEDCPNGSEILAKLDRMQFRMSPLFRGIDDLDEDVYSVFECLVARHQR